VILQPSEIDDEPAPYIDERSHDRCQLFRRFSHPLSTLDQAMSVIR
jgi:hypothetical protein